MRIVFTGGGTLGSVSPLLALVSALQNIQAEMQFIGTTDGPERLIIQQVHIPFTAITAPKFRRYWSWRHLCIPFELFFGMLQSFVFLVRWRPDCIVSAGGFVSVPVLWVGWLLRIPSIIHQQDLQPGLANILMQPFAQTITVAFNDSLQYFPSHKSIWIGNPVRDLTPTTHIFSLDPAVPAVLIFGGGTGAQAINELVTAALCEYANVIHITGKGKSAQAIITHPRYHAFELLNEEMKEALAKADLVVARAGLSTISELAALGKPSIIIPMPDSHQEKNAEFLQQHQAARILDQRTLTPQQFLSAIQELLQDSNMRTELSQNIHALHAPNASQQFVERITHISKT